MRCLDHPEPGIGDAREQRRDGLGRAVVDDQQLELASPLSQRARDRRAQPVGIGSPTIRTRFGRPALLLQSAEEIVSCGL